MARLLLLLFAFVVISISATEFESSTTESTLSLTSPKRRPLVCGRCMAVVGLINEVAIENTYRTKQVCDDYCDKTYGQTPSGRACKQWLDKDLDNILDKLKTGWSATAICQHFNLCF